VTVESVTDNGVGANAFIDKYPLAYPTLSHKQFVALKTEDGAPFALPQTPVARLASQFRHEGHALRMSIRHLLRRLLDPSRIGLGQSLQVADRSWCESYLHVGLSPKATPNGRDLH
jgi:hypothetical protein